MIRGYLQQLHAAWRSLTAAQRTQWNRFINFSNQTIRRDSGVLMSGHDLFIKYNLAKLMIGDSILSVPTYISMPVVPTVPETDIIGSDGVDMVFSVESIYEETELFLLLQLSSPRIPSRSFSPLGLRNIPLTYDGSGSFAIATPYSAIFGFVPDHGVTLHYSFQWFSKLSPIFNAPIVGTTVVVAI